MKAASRAKDCFPLPPTPTNNALPRGDSRILLILNYGIIIDLKNMTWHKFLVLSCQ